MPDTEVTRIPAPPTMVGDPADAAPVKAAPPPADPGAPRGSAEVEFMGIEKSIEAAQLVHRLLISACAVLLVFGLSTDRPGDEYDAALTELQRVERAVDSAGVLAAAQLEDEYRGMVNGALPGVPVGEVNLEPSFVHRFAAGSKNITLEEVYNYFSTGYSQDSLTVYELSPVDLRRRLAGYGQIAEVERVTVRLPMGDGDDGGLTADVVLDLRTAATKQRAELSADSAVRISEMRRVPVASMAGMLRQFNLVRSLEEEDSVAPVAAPPPSLAAAPAPAPVASASKPLPPGATPASAEAAAAPGAQQAAKAMMSLAREPEGGGQGPERLDGHEIFPALTAVWDEVGTIQFRFTRSFLERAQRRADEAARTEVSFMGLNLSSRFVFIAGPGTILLLLAYLLIHLVHVNEVSPGHAPMLRTLPWTGIHTHALGRLLLYASVTVLPVVALLVVTRPWQLEDPRRMAAQWLAIAAVLGLGSYLVWQFSRLQRTVTGELAAQRR